MHCVVGILRAHGAELDGDGQEVLQVRQRCEGVVGKDIGVEPDEPGEAVGESADLAAVHLGLVGSARLGAVAEHPVPDGLELRPAEGDGLGRRVGW